MSDDRETPAAPDEPPRSMRSFTIVAVVCLGILVTLSGVKSWRDLATARARQEHLEQRVEEARGRIEALRRQVDRLSDDPVTLERLAREDLGLVKPDDLVIVLPEEAPLTSP